MSLCKNKKGKSREKTKNYKGKSKDESIPWKWTDEQEQAFVNIKARLTSPPILSYPDQYLPFELHTDASGRGLGGCYTRNKMG